MNEIKAPTDNLYKFIAIAGLTLIIVAIIFPARFRQDVELQRFKLDGEIMQFRAEIDYWTNKILLWSAVAMGAAMPHLIFCFERAWLRLCVRH